MHSQHYRIESNGQVFYVNIHHNGDYSGNAMINVRQVPLTDAPIVDSEQIGISELNERYPLQEVELPIVVVKEFMASYIRRKRIVELEDASLDELLF